MRPGLQAARQRLRAALDRLVHAVVILRAQGRRWMMIAAAATLMVPLVAVGACWTWHWLDPPPPAAKAEESWRYLLVCESCGYRLRSAEHPARTLPRQNGLLRCPKCGQFKAAWFRRGSQTVPPGGW